MGSKPKKQRVPKPKDPQKMQLAAERAAQTAAALEEQRRASGTGVASTFLVPQDYAGKPQNTLLGQ